MISNVVLRGGDLADSVKKHGGMVVVEHTQRPRSKG